MSKVWLLLLICALCIIADCTAIDRFNLFKSKKGKKPKERQETEEERLERKRKAEAAMLKIRKEQTLWPGVKEEDVAMDGTIKKKVYFYPPPNGQTTIPDPIDLSDLENGQYQIQCHKNSATQWTKGDWKSTRLGPGWWTDQSFINNCEEPVMCNFLGWTKTKTVFDDENGNNPHYIETYLLKEKIRLCWVRNKIVVLYRPRRVPQYKSYPKKLSWGNKYKLRIYEDEDRESELNIKKYEEENGEGSWARDAEKRAEKQKKIDVILERNDMRRYVGLSHDRQALSEKERREQHEKRLNDMEHDLDKFKQWNDMIDEENKHGLFTSKSRREYDDMYLRGFAKGFKMGLKRH